MPGIHNLPLELISEIALYLDFVDVISLRKSTRTLRQAMGARVVWLSFARKYIAKHFNLPRPENGTIETLETQDLHEWIWPRLAIDHVWSKKTATPTKRVLDVHSDMVRMYLVPGGRWLLAFRDTGHVDSYDLDSKEPTAQLLSEPITEDHSSKGVIPGVPLHAARGPPAVLATSMNTQAPALDFTVVVSLTESPYWKKPPPLHLGWLFIQRVNLAGSDSGSPTLQARRVSPIPHIRTDTNVTAVGLDGPLVARFSTISCVDSWLEVFRWTECSSKELMAATICLGHGQTARAIYFIGEDRILILALYRIFIYRIPPLTRVVMDGDGETGYRSHDETVAVPLWWYEQEWSGPDFPGSFAFDGTGYRLVIQDDEGILGFRIPLSPDEDPFIQFEMPLDYAMPVMNGLYKGCAVYPDGTIIRLRYGSDEDDAVGNFVNYARPSDERSSRNPCFDEETGRCVVKTGHEIWVLDYLSC